MGPLTDCVKAVDVEACGTPVSYVDLLQGVIRAVGQDDLHGHHAGLVQTWLPGEVVLSGQTFSRHVVKQLVGFNRAKGWSGDLEGRQRENVCSSSEDANNAKKLNEWWLKRCLKSQMHPC